MPMKRKLYATRGAHIVCPNGHHIANLARNVYRGEAADLDIFCNHGYNVEIRPGVPNMHLCPRCGAEWLTRVKGSSIWSMTFSGPAIVRDQTKGKEEK